MSVKGGTRKPGKLVDNAALGRGLRAARLLAGLSVPQLAREATGMSGRTVTLRMIYSYERGEALPPLDVWTALYLILAPTSGRRWFLAAVRQDARGIAKKVWQQDF